MRLQMVLQTSFVLALIFTMRALVHLHFLGLPMSQDMNFYIIPMDRFVSAISTFVCLQQNISLYILGRHEISHELPSVPRGPYEVFCGFLDWLWSCLGTDRIRKGTFRFRPRLYGLPHATKPV